MRLLIFWCVGVFTISIASAAPPELSVVITEAKRLSGTPEGKNFEGAFSTAISQPFANAMRVCTAGAKAPLTFDLVFIVSIEGRVASVVHTPDQPVASCVAAKLQGQNVPRPPHDSWPVHIHMAV